MRKSEIFIKIGFLLSITNIVVCSYYYGNYNFSGKEGHGEKCKATPEKIFLSLYLTNSISVLLCLLLHRTNIYNRQQGNINEADYNENKLKTNMYFYIVWCISSIILFSVEIDVIIECGISKFLIHKNFYALIIINAVFNNMPLILLVQQLIMYMFCWKKKKREQQEIVALNQIYLDINLDCGICKTNKINRKMSCGHCICNECLEQLRDKKCPYCNKNIMENNLGNIVIT